MESDVDYFLRRAAEEASLAQTAETEDAAQLHLDLAQRYASIAELYRLDPGGLASARDGEPETG